MTLDGCQPRPSEMVVRVRLIFMQEATKSGSREGLNPPVWSVRALQEIFLDLANRALASIYPD